MRHLTEKELREAEVSKMLVLADYRRTGGVFVFELEMVPELEAVCA